VLWSHAMAVDATHPEYDAAAQGWSRARDGLRVRMQSRRPGNNNPVKATKPSPSSKSTSPSALSVPSPKPPKPPAEPKTSSPTGQNAGAGAPAPPPTTLTSPAPPNTSSRKSHDWAQMHETVRRQAWAEAEDLIALAQDFKAR
jgi:hypothetical protein